MAGWSPLDYSVAKTAVIHLTRWAAVELGEYGVRVDTISPGPVLTGIFAKAAGADRARADANALALEPVFASWLGPWCPLPRRSPPCWPPAPGWPRQLGLYLRKHYLTPLVTSSHRVVASAWILGRHWAKAGHPVSLSVIARVMQGAPHQLAGNGGIPPIVSYITRHGCTQWTASATTPTTTSPQSPAAPAGPGTR